MKIRIVSPYFLGENGTLPQHFQLYLNSCGRNPEFEWLFITNAKMNDYKIPDNVTVIQMSFEELKEYIQRKFDVPISLHTPYKLCDYKVLYGYIFEEYLQGYDFWGYADSTDLIWGKLSDFVTTDILEQYDKIYTKGHLTLYRNQECYTKCFMQYEKDGLSYRDAIQSDEAWATDETGRINISDAWSGTAFTEYVKDADIADISPLRFEFRLATQLSSGKIVEEENQNRIFCWKDGKVVGYRICDNQIKQKEFAYVHFQKRTMGIECDITDMENEYFIVPNAFAKEIAPEIEQIRKLSKTRLFYKKFFELKWNGLKRRLKIGRRK